MGQTLMTTYGVGANKDLAAKVRKDPHGILKEALYYSTREDFNILSTGGCGEALKVKNELLLGAIMALESGVKFTDLGGNAAKCAVQSFIYALSDRGLLKRATPILEQNGVVLR